MNQHTIKEEVTISGVGLHSGEFANLVFKPAAPNSGFVFKRIDLEGQPEVPARVKYVSATNRSTTIQKGKASVMTVEHALSALSGMQIDNVMMEIDGPEVPILDGSAGPFVELLEYAGLEEQDAPRKVFEIEESISYKDEQTGAEYVALPSEKFEITSLIDFNSKILGQQFAQLDAIEDYKEEIASCRTFVFLRELALLADQNLIKGGDLDNAIVIMDKPMPVGELSRLAKKLDRPPLEVDDDGILNNLKLTFKNEPARHKLLDIIGDLALLGVPIKGKIVAKKPGHRVNTEFVKVLAKQYQEQLRLHGKPNYDPSKEPVYNTMAVERILPHRHPFLLIDKIIELSKDHVVGIKNVTYDEYFFKGHFPDNPVMPGVLQIEAMAQTGGVLALSTVDDPQNWNTYFLKINNAKFKQLVVPGDTLVLKIELVDPIRRGLCHMQGTIYVGNTIVAEADMTAILTRKKKNE